MALSSASIAKKKEPPGPDVPLFLRKTYHMIDTGDTSIVCWSDDGTTFVVKDPRLFETTIIPQFFKHSKFTSFVRQLNFYGFRKIQYSDTLRIDAKRDAETANYWRFKHEHFQRDQPEGLKQIKRTPSTSSSSSNHHNGVTPTAAAQNMIMKMPPDSVLSHATSPTSSSSIPIPDTVGSLSSFILKNSRNQGATTTSAAYANNCAAANNAVSAEMVSTLKLRIEQMTQNIDALTAMVQKVSLKQDAQQQQQQQYQETTLHKKRPKMGHHHEHDQEELVLPDELVSMELDGMVLLPDPDPPSLLLQPSPYPQAVISSELLPASLMMEMQRQTSTTSSSDSNITASQVSDLDFVDTLFTSFQGVDHTSSSGEDNDDNDDDGDDDEFMILNHSKYDEDHNDKEDTALPLYMRPLPETTPIRVVEHCNSHRDNRPDAELMRRLSDALVLLPKETQEMIINRLIEAITSSALVVNAASPPLPLPLPSLTSLDNDAGRVTNNVVVMEEAIKEEKDNDDSDDDKDETKTTASPYPLAAATLAALLKHYASQIRAHKRAASAAAAVEKSIPVIPVNA